MISTNDTIIKNIKILLENSTFEEIFSMISKNNDFALIGLRNKVFSEYGFNKNDVFYNRILLCEQEQNDILAVFMLLCTYNTNNPLTYKDHRLYSLKEIGNQVLQHKEIDKVYLELIVNGCLTYYFKKYSIVILSIDQLNQLDYIYEVSKVNANIAYYLLGYEFGENKDYIHNNKSFSNLNELYQDLAQDKKSLKTFSYKISKNYRFHAWLIYHGYNNILQTWLRTISEVKCQI